MKPEPHAPAIRAKDPRVAEVYGRRDPRVVAVCPPVAAGSRCRCLTELETADALLEQIAPR